ncbi:LPS export ABC transporter periplasmic protein LptC [Flavobacterium laiguense]|uniref:LPS export ABC transporter periplasmic protein LptC n=1 Tax=Flavobacterium laiguense TaxID=2169409 RepID=A0A2U1JPA6_9FLAO|nr:LPS export ABC transporter periplasmic protein LptC [Flavobacterium laiguense]PWA07010.1 LPS export ABC transporter periplasmic protein LptC [Flavobacterium laiguense]
MTFYKRYFSFLVLLALAMGVSLGCESNFKEVRQNDYSEFVPSGDADHVNLKYTDSGRVKSILVSPKMLDYANVDFAFTEFPKGIDVTLYDNKGKKTFIKSNYAVSYKATSIIDLQGKVKITSENGQMLETEQLYFDQKNQWFYTEKKFKLTDAKGGSTGQGIDFSKDFKVVNSQRIEGEIESSE